MNRIVLFGGGGFIGSHIASALEGRDVVAPARSAVDLLSLRDLRAAIQRGDIVVNAAGYAQATDRTAAGRARLHRSNVQGVKNLATAGAEAGIAQLIQISSVAAMGRLFGLEHNEQSTGPIISPYAESKRQAEVVLETFRDALPITVLRPTSVFGEGRGLAAMLCRMARLPVLPLPSGGHTLIPFSYVKNVADAVVTAIGNEATFDETFIVGDEQSYALRDIIAGLATRLGSHSRIVPIPSWFARAAVRVHRLASGRPLIDSVRLHTLMTSVSYSTGKFRDATGYVPKYSLDDALTRLAAWHMKLAAVDANG